MEYATPSRVNPGLIIFVVDVSGSMAHSGVLNDIKKAMEHVRAIGRKKPRMIKFRCVTFSVDIRDNRSWLENARMDIFGVDKTDKRTHLKKVCDYTRRIYDDHVKSCKAKNPLTNILFFTDGGHSPNLDVDFFDSFQGSNPNKWSEKNPSQWLGLENMPNVLTGVIDYDKIKPMESLPQLKKYHPQRTYRFTAASVLEENIVRQAYKHEEEDRTLSFNESLEGIFGPPENLIGRQLIIGNELIKKHPRLTLAFVKIGTFSFRTGRTNQTNEWRPPPGNEDPGPLGF